MGFFAALLPLLIWLALIIIVIYFIIKFVKTSTERRDQAHEQIQMQLAHLQHEVDRLREMLEEKENEGGDNNE